MGTLQAVFTPITSISQNSNNNHRKREIYRGGAKYIWYTAPPPQKEHNKAINYIHTIVQGMKTQSYDLEGLAQSNTVITSSNSEVMTQLSQMTVIMNAMQRQLKILSSA